MVTTAASARLIITNNNNKINNNTNNKHEHQSTFIIRFMHEYYSCNVSCKFRKKKTTRAVQQIQQFKLQSSCFQVDAESCFGYLQENKSHYV